MSIRRVVNDDFNSIMEFNRSVQAFHQNGEPKLFKEAIEVPSSFEDFKVLLKNDCFLLDVIEIDGEIAAYFMGEIQNPPENPYRFPAKFLYVHVLGVRENYRGQGLAKKLLDYETVKAKEVGCIRIELDVWAFNEGARRLYNSARFRTHFEHLVLDL